MLADMKQLLIFVLLICCVTSSTVSADTVVSWQHWDVRTGRWVMLDKAPRQPLMPADIDRFGTVTCRGPAYRLHPGASTAAPPRQHDRRWLAPAAYRYYCGHSPRARVIRLSAAQARMPWAGPRRP